MAYTASTGSGNRLSQSEMVRLLKPPESDVDIVIDTDTYNEIDDQFALVYAQVSKSINVEAVYAAPFHNQKSEGPEDGMEKSYDEILRVLELLDHSDPEGFTLRGATRYMDDADGPVENPAMEDLIERARSRRGDDPLYVVAIGAPTNVSSAIKRDPEIVNDIVVIWLGGHPHTWHTAEEFNLLQDLRASRVLFDSGVPLVQIPCKNVAQYVRTTVPELESHLSGRGELSEYLLEIFTEYQQYYDDRNAWSKEIWDMAPIAYLIDPEWVPTHVVHSPRLSGDLRYSHDSSRHLMRVAKDARRDYIFDDFFERLGQR